MNQIYSNLVSFADDDYKCIIHKYLFSLALSWNSMKWFRKFYKVIEYCVTSISISSIKSEGLLA